MSWFTRLAHRLRKARGLDFPDPVIGQIWRSKHSGKRIRVCGVETCDRGYLYISVQHEATYFNVYGGSYDTRFGIGDHYAIGLDEWRQRLRAEARILEANGHE